MIGDPTSSPDRDGGTGALPFAASGALAAALLLGIAELLSAGFSTASSPFVSLGAVVIDGTPPWLKDAAVATLGFADKPVLLLTMGAVALVLAGLLGVLARRRLGLSAVLCAVLGALLAAAVLSRPGTSAADAVPTVIGTLAGLAALVWLVRRARRMMPDAGRPDTVRLPARRIFLIGAGVTALAAVLSAAGGRALSAASRAATAARDSVRLPSARHPAAALPAGVQSPAPGMPPFVTPNAEFYRIDTALLPPSIDPREWRLRVHGLVEQEFTLGFEELLGLDLEEAWISLTCVSNTVGGELAGTAKWLGYPLRELLARARPLDGADMVLSASADGFTASTPLKVLTDDRAALLAVGMNGEPLPRDHGYPVRMVVPGLYGYVSATKWVVDLEVTRFADHQAYWTRRGWSDRGPIKLASRFDVPRRSTTVPAAGTVLGGTAWAQGTGIEGVQVQVDGGRWQDATLAAEATVDTWRQWSLPWSGSPGDHTALVRAVSHSGEVQTSQRANPVPNGASGWDELRFRAE